MIGIFLSNAQRRLAFVQIFPNSFASRGLPTLLVGFRFLIEVIFETFFPFCVRAFKRVKKL